MRAPQRFIFNVRNHGVDHGFVVRMTDQITRVPMDNKLLHAANVGGDHRQPAGHGLDDGAGQPLPVTGQYEYVRSLKSNSDIFNKALEYYGGFYAAEKLSRLLLLRTITVNMQFELTGASQSYAAHGLRQSLIVFLIFEPRGCQEHHFFTGTRSGIDP